MIKLDRSAHGELLKSKIYGDMRVDGIRVDMDKKHDGG
jgi:hypothetical protein